MTAVQSSALEEGSSFDELLLQLLPPAPQEPLSSISVVAPPLGGDHLAALDRLPDVYGVVSPLRPRQLSPEEIAALRDEREVLDLLGKLISNRSEQIKAIVHAHLDAEIDASLGPDDLPPPRHPQHGFYLVPGEIKAGWRRFRRNLVNRTKPTLDPEMLASMVRTGELSRQDYLAMTVESRQVDPARVLKAVRQKPGLTRVIQKATKVEGQITASITFPKA